MQAVICFVFKKLALLKRSVTTDLRTNETDFQTACKKGNNNICKMAKMGELARQRGSQSATEIRAQRLRTFHLACIVFFVIKY